MKIISWIGLVVFLAIVCVIVGQILKIPSPQYSLAWLTGWVSCCVWSWVEKRSNKHEGGRR